MVIFIIIHLPRKVFHRHNICFQILNLWEGIAPNNWWKSGKPVNGLVSLGIFYFVAAIANWITPAIMVFTGAKMAILIGGLVNTLYIGMLIFAPKERLTIEILSYVWKLLAGYIVQPLRLFQFTYFLYSLESVVVSFGLVKALCSL